MIAQRTMANTPLLASMAIYSLAVKGVDYLDRRRMIGQQYVTAKYPPLPTPSLSIRISFRPT